MLFTRGATVPVRIPTILCGMWVRTQHTIQVMRSNDQSASSYLPVVSGKTARSRLHSL
jgi:hypothetical protein